MFGQTLQERFDIRDRAMDHQLDTAIVEVTHRSRQVGGAGEIHAGRAKSDTLHPAGKENRAVVLTHERGDYTGPALR